MAFAHSGTTFFNRLIGQADISLELPKTKLQDSTEFQKHIPEQIAFLNLKVAVILAVKNNSHEYVHNENNRSRRLLKPWLYKGIIKS